MKSGITAELPVVWADQNHIICQEAQINYQTCKKNMHTHTHTHNKTKTGEVYCNFSYFIDKLHSKKMIYAYIYK